ncbi:ferrous iron transport protein A [Clostridium botulinum]|uniref:Ferrous iron transport protein A n=1 Tax=Clostridium botulinum TaxID=1491 RepID=A0A093WDK2_CLOBO|nr:MULTISPECIES: FeoA family protein [Clostridium]AIY81367.1 feoA domain protein [Clostridium botulinum 202F]NFJ39513.1 ferrous iron transport protein A [Clostridium botulinum B str. Eklund 17B (NRP)]ACD51054.1 conserved domain protein [Clostridium botulinum E3 str. Alaska E43]AJF30600.1 iron transporter FeoA [Clostridium botulinum]AJF33663.1 iron transporter FeoA [Clostridium botulinum]
MPLILANTGECMPIKKIRGNDETKKFLSSLGFITGETVSIISEIAGSLIIKVKGSRIALDKSMASRIIV